MLLAFSERNCILQYSKNMLKEFYLSWQTVPIYWLYFYGFYFLSLAGVPFLLETIYTWAWRTLSETLEGPGPARVFWGIFRSWKIIIWFNSITVLFYFYLQWIKIQYHNNFKFLVWLQLEETINTENIISKDKQKFSKLYTYYNI